MYIHGVSPNFSRIDGLFVSLSHQYNTSEITPVAKIKPVNFESQNSLNTFPWQDPAAKLPLLEKLNRLVYHDTVPANREETNKNEAEDIVGHFIDQAV